MNNKTFIIVIVLLVGVAAVGIASYLPTRFDSTGKVKMSDFPMTVGGWQATDIPLTERDYEILETRNLIMREYKNSKGESVLLYIIYSEDNRKVSHPPEVCYMGSGLTIVEKAVAPLTSKINAVKMSAEKLDAHQLVLYWFKAGNMYTDKYMQQQLKIVLDRTFGKRTSSAMIRLSADIKKDGTEEEAMNTLKLFATQIEPLLDKYVP